MNRYRAFLDQAQASSLFLGFNYGRCRELNRFIRLRSGSARLGLSEIYLVEKTFYFLTLT
jgi:hypothetical protein